MLIYGRTAWEAWSATRSATWNLDANSAIIQNIIARPVKHKYIFPENLTCFDHIIHYQAKYRLKKNNSAFTIRLSKTTENLDWIGQLQDLSGAHWLLASSPTLKCAEKLLYFLKHAILFYMGLASYCRWARVTCNKRINFRFSPCIF